MRTAKQLGITQAEVDGLIFFRDQLRAGTYQMDMATSGPAPGLPLCGSAACLGGNLWLYLNNVQQGGKTTSDQHQGMFNYVFGHNEMYELFFPPEILKWSTITGPAIADAIDNFLNTGKPDWNDVHTNHKEICTLE